MTGVWPEEEFLRRRGSLSGFVWLLQPSAWVITNNYDHNHYYYHYDIVIMITIMITIVVIMITIVVIMITIVVIIRTIIVIILAIDFPGRKRNRNKKIRAQLRILKCITIVK